LGGLFRKRLVYAEHHESHAASAFYPSPFAEAAVLTVDGVGEWSTASYGVGQGHRLELHRELRFPHSPGLLYSAFTQYCGFKVNSGEYKLMGLAPYGEPRFADLILEKMIDLKPDGSFRLDLSYFQYCEGLRMISPRFTRLFGRPPREPETPIVDPLYMDVAASIQKVIEEILLRMAHHIQRETGQENLCLAGGVALNCVANGRLLREGPFRDLWIQPAAGDAGGALGVALLIWHQLLGQPRVPEPLDSQRGSLLGPAFSDEQIAAFLEKTGAVSERFADDAALCERVAGYLASGRVVGWFQGRMEFGPRALGSRSILGDARDRGMQSQMNLKIKFRESFRPFAPAVLAERSAEVFDVPGGFSSPYMLLVAPVRAERRVAPAPGDELLRGIDKLRSTRSDVPAITHVDYSARIQTVDAVRHGRYHRLLEAFRRRTGSPVLINTSFNVRGEPIVCSPADAYRCFLATDMDILVLERHVLLKERQPPGVTATDRQSYLAEFRLD
jgi:carbamoyltransferase